MYLLVAALALPVSQLAVAEAARPSQPETSPEAKPATAAPTGPAGIITTVAGIGINGYSGNGGLATRAELNEPGTVVVDGTGNLYIAERNFQVVRKVTAATGIISVYAGSGVGGYSGDNGPATAATLNTPVGLALDASGNLFIADSYNNVIREVNAKTGIITTVAGNGYGANVSGNLTCGAMTTGVSAISAPLCYPFGVAVDSAGNLYISSFSWENVLKVTKSTGLLTLVAGTGGYGYTGDGGLAVNAKLSYPWSVAVDGAQNVYIADLANCAIRKVTASTGVITSLVGSPRPSGYGGHCGLGGDGGPATAALISDPYGVFVDASGNVLIADSNNALVRMIAANNGNIYTLAGSYTNQGGHLYGNWGYAGDGGPAANAKLDYPQGVALDSAGNLYIADAFNGAIRKVTQGLTLPTGAPTITPASGAGATPATVTITPAAPGSAIYYTTNGTLPTTASTQYTAPFALSGTAVVTAFATLSGAPNSPAAVAYYLYAPTPVIAPGSETVTTATPVTITDGNTKAKIYYTTDNSDPTAGGATVKLYSGPISITATATLRAAAFTSATDAGGNVYGAWSPIAWAGYTLLTGPQTAPSGIITTVAGNGLTGYSGDGGLATRAELIYPNGVAADSAGNLYIPDVFFHVVRKVTAATGIISLYAGNGIGGYSGDNGPATAAKLDQPYGVAVDSSGNLYIADLENGVIREVNARTGIITAVAGQQASKCKARIDGIAATSASLCGPFNLAVDGLGNLFIADNYDYVIREVNAKTGIISTVAGNGNYGYTGDGGPAVSAELGAESVAVDGAGNLYIGDDNNCAIRKVTAATGIISSLVGSVGSGGYANCGLGGDGGPASIAKIYYPNGVAVDSGGNVFIADTDNSLIRMISASNGNIYTVAGSYTNYGGGYLQGNSGYSGNGGPAIYADLNYPGGLSLDPSGNLYIADTSNIVIRKVTMAATLPSAAPTISPGSGVSTSPVKVTITPAGSGSTVYYTTNGAMPTTSSTKYTAPFTLNASAVVTAFATVSGQVDSPATEAYFLYAPAPTFSPAAGKITKATPITITDANSTAKISYTLDGSDPTAGGATVKSYSGPVSVSPGTTLKAAAWTSVTPAGSGAIGVWSTTTTGAFTSSATPKATPQAGGKLNAD